MSDECEKNENECRVSVGCPTSPESFGLFGGMWKSYQFHFHDFPDFNSEKGQFVASPEFKYNGHLWRVEVYPGGAADAEGEGVSIFLCHRSEGNITVACALHITDKFGRAKAGSAFAVGKEMVVIRGDSYWGADQFGPRSRLLDESNNLLDDGCLTIIASITEVTDAKFEFVPKNSAPQMLTEMFNDEDSADVCFEVSCCIGQKLGKRKKRSKSSVSFHAHRNILRKFAPVLADVLGENNTTTVEDVKPEIFCHLLHYVYGGEVSGEELKKHAKEIINAADKYAIVNLKLAAEVAYVESTDITVDNAVENLLYADSKNCALIKETVVDFLSYNAEAASENISYTGCPGHMIKDILNSFVRRDAVDNNSLNLLDISQLRWQLHEKGLDVDGSREAMIDAINNNDEEK